MPNLLTQAFRLARTRPLMLGRRAGEYCRFCWNTWLSRRVFKGGAHGVHLGENARIQRIGALMAERPGASIRIGDGSIIYELARIEAYGSGSIRIGPQCIIGEARIYSRGSIQVGARVLMAWNVFIQDFDPHPVDPVLRGRQVSEICERFRPDFRRAAERLSYSASLSPRWDFEPSAIEIGDDVWIGAGSTILKGARIGDGSVVAAGSVVPAGDWPAYSVLAGTPARVVKRLGPRREAMEAQG